MKIIDALWFTPMSGECIGIIIIECEHSKERKCYIGCGQGLIEGIDAELIADTGAKLHLETIDYIKEKLFDIKQIRK